jgi:RNA polymerase sigma-70 factor, ECF subfamily
MLGSLHDAEDALQDALLCAWRGLPGFGRRSSLRSWLYRIATNACHDARARRPSRVVPINDGSFVHRGERKRGGPLAELILVEPYAAETLGAADGYPEPAARYEHLEAVELAFVAALRHLPARQRAVLILREVLGFSAKEVSASLGATVASVNSTLQRARKAVDERRPDKGKQATIRSLGDERLHAIVQNLVDAFERGDVHVIVSHLADDGEFAMSS